MFSTTSAAADLALYALMNAMHEPMVEGKVDRDLFEDRVVVAIMKGMPPMTQEVVDLAISLIEEVVENKC